MVLVLFHTYVAGEGSKDVEEFRRLFQQKRMHQLGAIKQLLTMDPERQVKLLDAMLSKMSGVMTSSQNMLLSSNSEDIGNQQIPRDTNVRDALALAVENTCMASDILLRFPNYMSKKLDKEREFDAAYKWGLQYVTTSAQYLLDDNTKRLFHLATQELGMVDKDPDYHNPYRQQQSDGGQKKESRKIMFADDEPAAAKGKKAKKAKKKLQRGPRLASTEL